MKFILIADNEKLEPSFFPWWQMLVFIGVVSLTFFILFPRHLLEKTLEVDQPSPAVLNYLQAFRDIYPKDTQINLNIVEQEINLGLLKQARENIAHIKNNGNETNSNTTNQLHWMDYLIIRYKAYHTKPTTSVHIFYLRQLRHMTTELASTPLKAQQLKILAQDSLAVAQASTALKIYNHLFDINALTTSDELAEGASIAMQNNAHRDSAKFYKAAYIKASNALEKKYYALEVIKVLWAGNLLQEALSYAQTLPESVINDQETLLYLSQLAIAANRPDIAEDYAVKALLLQADNHNE